MAWFNFIKNKRRKRLAEKGLSVEIVRLLGETNPDLLHTILTAIDTGEGIKQLPMSEHEKVQVKEVKDVSVKDKEDSDRHEEQENPELENDFSETVVSEKNSEEETHEKTGAGHKSSVDVNYEFKTGESAKVAMPNNAQVKDTIKVDIPDGKGTTTEVFVWDEREEEDFDPNEFEMLNKDSSAVGNKPMDNPRVVVIGAKGSQSPEVLAYYEVLKSFGKMLVDESEVTVLKKYDAFYFAGVSQVEELNEKQIELAQNAKNLYVVYLEGKSHSLMPFKREFHLLVPFKAVERYDALSSRMDFLIDYTNIEIKDKKQVKSINYINTLSLLNNNNQLLRTKTIRAKKPNVMPLTDYVYINNYHKNIAFPLNKVSKNLDITVYGQSKPEIVALAVTFSSAVDYYSAPVYIESYHNVLHFVETEDVNLQKADSALLTYAEAGVPMAVVAPNSPNKEEYLALISPENEDRILTKDELFKRFGDGKTQLKKVMS